MNANAHPSSKSPPVNGWGGEPRAKKAKTKKAVRNNNMGQGKKGPKGKRATRKVSASPTSYARPYKTAARTAARSGVSRPIVRVKKLKHGDSEFELITVTAEDNAENNAKYAAEGFEKKAGITRELRSGPKSMAVWVLTKPVVGKAAMNNLAAMFSGIGLGKVKSPSPVRVANIAAAVQEEVDDAMAELAGMMSSKARV